MFTTAALRRVSAAVLIAFSNLIAQPVVAAVQLPDPPQARQESAEEKHGRKLDALRQRLERAKAKAERFEDDSADVAAIVGLGDDLMAEAGSMDAGFAAVEGHLQSHNLPPEILDRHRDAVTQYRTKRAAFQERLQSLKAARNDPTQRRQKALDLADFMQAEQKHRVHTPSDPNNLPFRAPKGKARAPIETTQGYKQSLFKPQPLRLAANGSLSGIGLPGTTLPALPNAQDLAETEDIQLTPALRAKAQELGNNPVKIHNWVRNSLEFIPSYGSLQGAELTLQSKRGNAFDTASLEIALLRAANIPARYVYGTIQLPADQVMNWVGGVSTPEAAQSLLGQGGIPNVAVVSGGKISAFRLEHVWVEAYVDYVPSRGAVHRQGDTWAPLDASFKQYAYTPGMDLKTQVPLDAQGLIDQIKQGATVNEAEGWVQNLNSTALQSQLADYQTRVKSHIDSTKPDATVGDVLGAKTIIAHAPSILMGTLPYQTLVTGAKLQSLPDNLKWQFRTTLADAWGGELANLNQTTPTLAGKKLTLSFLPASQADLDLINSYLPNPHPDGSPIQPSELPSSLPGYLIKLKAEIRLDGQLVSQSTSSLTMGSELRQTSAYFNPGSQQWEDGEANHPIAGEYHALALDLQGVSASQLTALKIKLEQTKTKLEQFQANPNDSTPISNLTKEDLSGDLLYSGILGYFASVDGSDQLAAKSNGNIVAYRLPSYGSFKASVQTHYWFGIPRSVSFPGVTMDVDRVYMHAEAKDGDTAKKLAYMRQVGSAGSAFEHSVPERLFADSTKPLTDPSQPQGISAVKAIAIAAANGQKVYTLNAQNQAYHSDIVAGLNTDADTKAEIANALNAGMEVTVHQADITAHGWTGSGYIILDPETGAGAYKISGGANGAYYTLIGLATGLVVGTAIVVAGPFVVGLVGAIGLLTSIFFSLTLDNTDLLDYTAARFIGTVSGLVLSIILGQYVFISFPILFVLGFLWLMISVIRLLVVEMYTALTRSTLDSRYGRLV